MEKKKQPKLPHQKVVRLKAHDNPNMENLFSLSNKRDKTPKALIASPPDDASTLVRPLHSNLAVSHAKAQLAIPPRPASAQKGAILSVTSTMFSKKSRIYLQRRKEESKFAPTSSSTLSPYELVNEPKRNSVSIAHSAQTHKTAHSNPRGQRQQHSQL